ncbi:MAG: alanine--glyoxylate aminotransferase family protein [Bacteroidales bacterium]|jgi:alanine-glyoxylate transaminase/serine-glyoxylate transaminase/serine-pyruvate transaminase|nr:alanine--glyoxylate aminotransferase family protein [Bacteroidales bacterium]MCU0410188.1 alanine--glyoxylate aminotransferase family protein [Bacteroidales bacterium]
MKGRKLLMIPGPIEFEPAVMQATAMATTSHVAPDFIETFGHSLEMMRDVWLSPSGQPFIIAGTGTLAMDMAGSNLIEPGDRALVISTGYFGDRYADLLKRYGAEVTVLKAATGDVVDIKEVEKELNSKSYKLLTFTHVDTSTAVRVDPRPLGLLGQKYGVLTILDGVCSVAGEEIRQDEWMLDVVFTASQKAVGVPPGLALMVVSERAVNAWRSRKTPVGNYYCDWNNWLPVMKAYEERRPSYFGTPAVNLVNGLEVSLGIILKEGMEARFGRHRRIGRSFRTAMRDLGLKMIPISEEISAGTLSAPYYPDGVRGAEFMRAIAASDVILAGGLLQGIKDSYFRVGHMGSVTEGDILTTVSAIEHCLQKCGHNIVRGIGLRGAAGELQ